MKNLLLSLSIVFILISCGGKTNDPKPQLRTANTQDTSLVVTIYTNRTPAIFYHLNDANKWVYDTVKVNNATYHYIYKASNSIYAWELSLASNGSHPGDSCSITLTYEGKSAMKYTNSNHSDPVTYGSDVCFVHISDMK